MAVEPLVRRRKESWYFFSTCLHPWGSPLVQSSQLPVVKSFGDLARHPSTYQYLIQECKILHGFSEIVVLQGIIAVADWSRFSSCFGYAVCLLLLAARCLLPLQRLVCEIAKEVKPEMKFQSQAMSGTVWKRFLAVKRYCDA